MGDLDPRIEKVRRIGVGVFVALSIAAIPIGIHIVKTYESPELWLTLLGAVFMLLLICLYALETALTPIPKAKSHAPFSVDPEAETLLEEPDDDEEEHTEFHEPAIVEEGEDAKAVLVEVEEVPTHPPFQFQSPGQLEDQATELDPDRAHLRNPDAPIMTVPNSSLREAANTGDEDGEES